MAYPPEFIRAYQLFDAAASGDLRNLKRVASELSNGRSLAKTFIEIKDSKGHSVLHFAAGEGKLKICKYLIQDFKLSVNTRDGFGDTPLNHAVIREQYKTAVFLVENGTNPNLANEKKYSALHFAADKGNKKLLQFLICKGANIEAESACGMPLQVAAAKGKTEAVKLLLDMNANPNVVGNQFTPLMVSIFSMSSECTNLLLKAGADPNLGSLYGTPLAIAVGEMDTKAVRLLLQHGADPDVTNTIDMTPVEVAALQGCHEIVMLLLPLTTRVSTFPVWSVSGIISHVHSVQYKIQREQKKKEMFLLSKSKGAEAFTRRDYHEAIFWYTQAICSDPLDATVLSNRKGVARKMFKDFCGATEAFSEALKLDPENKEIKAAHREAVEAEFGIPVLKNLRIVHL